MSLLPGEEVKKTSFNQTKRNYKLNPLTVKNIPQPWGPREWYPGALIQTMPSVIQIGAGPTRTMHPQEIHAQSSGQSCQSPEMVSSDRLPSTWQDVEIVAAQAAPNILDYYPLIKKLLTGQ